jgi:hypothetical protein
MKLLIILLLSLNLIYAMSKPLELKIIYFNAGKENKTEISKSDQNKISQVLKKLFSNSDEAYKLYISDERINEIKKTDSGVEIFLGKSIVYKTKSLGNYKVKKIMIPFTGDFAGDEKSSEVTIFAGEKEYFTPPLISKNGFKNVKELEQIIRKGSGQLHK